MKLVDVFGNVPTQLSNEEYNVYTMLKKNTSMMFEDLQDRNKQIVLNLYFKNIVEITENGKITLNQPQRFEDIDW
jgi:chromatin segregation and condensation protein Rec8/ScpA/Scc1 (kleisin family)